MIHIEVKRNKLTIPYWNDYQIINQRIKMMENLQLDYLSNLIVHWFFIDFQIKSDLIAVLLFCNQTSKVIKVKQKAFFYKGPCFLGMRSIIVLNQRFYTRYVCSFKETSISFLAIKLGLSLIANFHLSSSTSSSSSQFTHVHTYIHSQEITSACTIINIWAKSKSRFFCNHETTFTGRQRLGLFIFFIVLEDDKKKSIVSAKQIFEPFFDGGQHFVPKQPNRVYVVLL